MQQSRSVARNAGIVMFLILISRLLGFIRERAIAASERFQPPTPPPFPRPRTWQRGVAWSGIFLAPALALVVALFSISLHPLFGWAMVLWPVGGFLYLVWEMPRAPREPWDDGSRI